MISFPCGSTPVSRPELVKVYISRCDGQLSMAPKKHRVSLFTFIRNGLCCLSNGLSTGLFKPSGLMAELLNISWCCRLSWHIAVKTPIGLHLGVRSLYIYTGLVGPATEGVVTPSATLSTSQEDALVTPSDSLIASRWCLNWYM